MERMYWVPQRQGLRYVVVNRETGEVDFARATVGYKNIVGKDWSMFNKQ